MKERALTVDAREAKGLHDGSITCLVRVIDPQPEGNPREVAWNTCINEWVPWAGIEGSRHGWTRCGPSLSSPLGIVGDRLIATPVYEHGQPCEHRGCKSHWSHPCEGCGRFWGVTLLDVTDVRVVRVQEVSYPEIHAMGFRCDVFKGDGYGGAGDRNAFHEAMGWEVASANSWLFLATVAKVTTERKPENFK